MSKDFESGSLPVPDLTNLDTYHEIGVELNLEELATLTDEAYCLRYKEKLDNWHRTFPIKADARFWKHST